MTIFQPVRAVSHVRLQDHPFEVRWCDACDEFVETLGNSCNQCDRDVTPDPRTSSEYWRDDA